MTRRIALVLSSLLFCATAQAQLFRAYLAPTGNDANNCTLAQPCRLLPAALAAVADGGEIWMLDSANYNTGMVNISKSVTILAVPGALGSVVSTNSASAIAISASTASVTLRNLVIAPILGTDPQSGVVMNDGLSLTIDKCVISGMPGSAILMFNAGVLRVVDSIVRDNGTGINIQSGVRASITRTVVSGHPFGGIYVGGVTPGITSADITDSTIDGNSVGVHVQAITAAAVAIATVRNSILTGNTDGLYADSTGASVASLAASGNTVSFGTKGIRSSGTGARVWARGNTVTGNTLGLAQENSSIFQSAGNNAVRANAIEAAGTIELISQQ